MTPVLTMDQLCEDLAAEHADLERLVAGLEEDGLATPTPAEGWAVRDQLSHLAWFDEAAVTAAVDPDAFRAGLAEALADLDAYVERPVTEGRARSADDLLGWWREARTRLVAALRHVDPAERVPWYGPAMSATSFATARLMETWAHGQDVADGLGATRAPSDRLHHVAHLGVRALPNSYLTRDLPVPAVPVRVKLTGPGGDPWVWGDEDAPDCVSGSALDFCLVVTQRRHVEDTVLRATGPVATEWLSIAQAFAGGPTLTERGRGLRS